MSERFRLAGSPSSASSIPALLRPAPAEAGSGNPAKGQSLFVVEGLRRVPCGPGRGRPHRARSGPHGGQGLLLRDRGGHLEPLAHDERQDEGVSARAADLQDDELARPPRVPLLPELLRRARRPQGRQGPLRPEALHPVPPARKGGGSAGPRLDALPRGTSPLRIAQDLWNHGPAMVPAIRRLGLDIPKFNGSEIIDLFAYLRSQGQRQAAHEFRSAGDPGRGKRLFREKGCSRCHAVFGEGAGIGPDLGSAELRGSVTQLAGRMWNHWPAMAEAMGALGMAPPTFKGEDVADLFAFLFVSRYESAARRSRARPDDLPAEGLRRLPWPGGRGRHRPLAERQHRRVQGADHAADVEPRSRRCATRWELTRSRGPASKRRSSPRCRPSLPTAGRAEPAPRGALTKQRGGGPR